MTPEGALAMAKRRLVYGRDNDPDRAPSISLALGALVDDDDRLGLDEPLPGLPLPLGPHLSLSAVPIITEVVGRHTRTIHSIVTITVEGSSNLLATSIPTSTTPESVASSITPLTTPTSTSMVITTTSSGVSTSTSSSVLQANSTSISSSATVSATALPESAAATSQPGFFQRKGEVATVFVIFALIIISLCAWFYYFLRRRRAATRPTVEPKTEPLDLLKFSPWAPRENGTIEPYPHTLLRQAPPPSAIAVPVILAPEQKARLDDKALDGLKEKYWPQTS